MDYNIDFILWILWICMALVWRWRWLEETYTQWHQGSRNGVNGIRWNGPGLRVHTHETWPESRWASGLVVVVELNVSSKLKCLMLWRNCRNFEFSAENCTLHQILSDCIWYTPPFMLFSFNFHWVIQLEYCSSFSSRPSFFSLSLSPDDFVCVSSNYIQEPVLPLTWKNIYNYPI